MRALHLLINDAKRGMKETGHSPSLDWRDDERRRAGVKCSDCGKFVICVESTGDAGTAHIPPTCIKRKL